MNKIFLSIVFLLCYTASHAFANNEEIVLIPIQNCLFENIPLNTSSWTQQTVSNALVVHSTDKLILHGDVWKNGRMDENGFVDGNSIVSTATFNHVGVSSYIKLKVHADDQYLWLQAKPNGMPIKLLTTHHSWANSDVLPEDTWLYIRTAIKDNGQWLYVISTRAYDDERGDILYSYSGTFSHEQLKAYNKLPFIISFFDNYGGVNTNLTVAEVSFDCIEIATQIADDSKSTCSPDNLALCQTSTSCVLEGSGRWCDGICLNNKCPVTTERNQCSEFNIFDNKLQINCVIIGDSAYQIDLSSFSTAPILLQLDHSKNFGAEIITGDCAEYDAESNLVNLSCINIDDNIFWADLELTSVDPILLGVQDAGIIGPKSEQLIKTIDINIDSNDPLAATIVDINNRYYRIYAVTDNANAVQFYDKLVIDQLNDEGTLEHYLTMTFDQYSRPISFTLADNKGAILLNYISGSQVSMTVRDADGFNETHTINNPFEKQLRSLTGQQVIIKKEVNNYRKKPAYTSSIILTYSGDIISCKKEDAPPHVSVKRHFNSILQSKYPLLAQSFDARVSVFDDKYDIYEDDEQPNFSYSYDITIPGDDFDTWSLWCKGGYSIDVTAGFIGYWAKKTEAVFSAFRAMYKDYTEKSIKNSARFVVEEIFDHSTKDIPIVSTISKLPDAWNVEGSGINGPCSKSVWAVKRKRLLHEQTITVNDKYMTEKVRYKPLFKWNSDSNDYLQLAPSFDFSQDCKKEDPPPSVPSCNDEVVKSITDSKKCAEAYGAWQSVGAYGSISGRCFCW